MPSLPENVAQRIADIAVDEVMHQLESHVDAHPSRYGRDLPDEALEAIRDRLAFDFEQALVGLEVPPP